jgi:transcriptional regulator with XRE-family HTH domain
MRERLIKFLESENLSSAKFADDIGVQRSSISHILSGRNNPSFEFIQKILAKYKYLNAEWLIMGTGNMIKTVIQGSLFEDLPIKTNQKPEIEPSTSTIVSNENILTQNPVNISNEPVSQPENLKSEEAKTTTIINNEILSQEIAKNEKQIEKVMIMYSDKTFTIYSPSN